MGHSNRYFREKKLLFLLLLFPLLCFTNKSQGNGVWQKSQHLGPPQLFWPLVPLCFVLLTTQLWCFIWVHHHQSFLQALCIVAIETSLQFCSQQVWRTHFRLPFKFYSTGWLLRRSSTSSSTKAQP